MRRGHTERRQSGGRRALRGEDSVTWHFLYQTMDANRRERALDAPVFLLSPVSSFGIIMWWSSLSVIIMTTILALATISFVNPS